MFLVIELYAEVQDVNEQLSLAGPWFQTVSDSIKTICISQRDMVLEPDVLATPFPLVLFS